MAFLAQLIGAVLGAIVGYALGGMMIAGIGDTTLDLHFILAGVGAVVGFVIGRLISGFADSGKSGKSTKGDKA